jgi:hypothetical protein
MKIVILGAGSGGRFGRAHSGERSQRRHRGRCQRRTLAGAAGSARYPHRLRSRLLSGVLEQAGRRRRRHADRVDRQRRNQHDRLPGRAHPVQHPDQDRAGTAGELYPLSASSCSSDEALPIDVLISPEQLVTDYIQRIIEHPGALAGAGFRRMIRCAWWASRPTRAAPWSVRRCAPCRSTCPVSTPGWPPSSARADRSSRKATR